MRRRLVLVGLLPEAGLGGSKTEKSQRKDFEGIEGLDWD